MVNVIGDDFLIKTSLKKNLNFTIILRKLKIQGKWAITLLKFDTFFNLFLNCKI